MWPSLDLNLRSLDLLPDALLTAPWSPVNVVIVEMDNECADVTADLGLVVFVEDIIRWWKK